VFWGGAILGILLCVIWWVMTESGYRLFNMMEASARCFKWESASGKIPNPIETGFDYEGGSRGGWIHKTAILLIVFFIMAWLSLVVSYLLA
jgi:hypothetical protein